MEGLDTGVGDGARGKGGLLRVGLGLRLGLGVGVSYHK